MTLRLNFFDFNTAIFTVSAYWHFACTGSFKLY